MEFRYRSQVDAYKQQITVPAMVAPVGWWGGKTKADISPENVIGVIDTGANISCISPHLAKRLNLKPNRKLFINSTDGGVLKDTYRIDIRFLISPFAENSGHHHTIHNVEVTETAGDIDRIIVGIGIITLGSLYIEKNDFTFCL